METKKLSTLYIRLNNNNVIAVEQSKTREKLDEISNKYHKLLEKYKKKGKF